ncbi:hypothetical protein N7541_005804 [Penicillium brevicompactum]|uniref:PRKR-interacting protein 1 n=1 Tax=Penicillium brevicompactum TaxID=5074 RepID=A0A9W9UTD2_PENBR|nr:hypothetical protein N7541_005804 [Penicillium brevicompactum]
MSEPGPESFPTSADPRSKRPTKRRAIQARISSYLIPLLSAHHRCLRPPEIVTNVQGSSAGAGSGEFHVYKASRRREYERLRMMQSEVDQEKDNESWEKERAEAKRKDDEKTDKNRRRREKKKNARGKKGGDKMDTAPTKTGPAPGTMVSADGDSNGAADGQPAQEVPGVIIHDDD